MWGEEYIIQPKKYLVKAVKDEKFIKRTKRTVNVMVSVAASVEKIWRQNHPCSLQQEGSSSVSVNF